MSTAGHTFGTLITCIDGRSQRPPVLWMCERFNVDYVDIITEPGPDKLLADGWPSDVVPVRKKVGISIAAHASRLIAICGHHDCAGNPVTPEVHREQILQSVRLVRSWEFSAEVVGLWLNERWEVEVVEGPLGTGRDTL